MFFEPSILWSGLGFDSGPTPGFTDDANIVFSPHLYAESITMDRSLGLPPIVGIERQFDARPARRRHYGVPLWSGEYGYWGDDADRVDRLNRYADAEDERMPRQRLLGVEAGLRRPAERHPGHRRRAHASRTAPPATTRRRATTCSRS